MNKGTGSFSGPFCFVTSRSEKVREARDLGFAVEQVDLDLPEPQSTAPRVVARAKAEAAFTILEQPVLVDDSGLEIGAWNGFPGALVKWLVKSVPLETIVQMLEPFPDRRARAVCALAAFDGERWLEAEGAVEGFITAAPRGSLGFGWDAIFLPDGSSRTFAEMEGEEKGRHSHRGAAWRELARLLDDSSR